MSRKSRRQQGFTLVEILLVLSLTALLTGLAYSALRTGATAWRATQEQTDQNDAVRISWQFLQHSLQNALPPATGGMEQQLLEGRPDELRFVSELPGYLGNGGPQHLWLHHDSNDDTLLLQVQSLAALRAGTAGQQTVLLQGVKGLSISYFGHKAGSGIPGWLDNWKDPENLPALIRIRLQTGDSAPWPSLLVHPWLGQRVDAPLDVLLAGPR